MTSNLQALTQGSKVTFQENELKVGQWVGEERGETEPAVLFVCFLVLGMKSRPLGHARQAPTNELSAPSRVCGYQQTEG